MNYSEIQSFIAEIKSVFPEIVSLTYIEDFGGKYNVNVVSKGIFIWDKPKVKIVEQPHFQWAINKDQKYIFQDVIIPLENLSDWKNFLISKIRESINYGKKTENSQNQ